jgi:hypothetical protein
MRIRGRTIIPIVLAILVALLCFDVGRLVLASSREASIDAVRIRNAMVAELGEPAQTDWEPSAIPSIYHWEKLAPPAFFSRIVDDVLPPETRQESALAQAVRLARHLRTTSRPGAPIQANSLETYQKIVGGQGGYCSDYTQAFDALALAAGLKVREWGFTWEDMANGHAFNEIWDATLSKWVFIDPFVSFYVVDVATGTPMSALEFRASLLDERGPGEARVIRIASDRFGFKTDQKALDWYRRGAPRMFLVLGNSVFSYDSNPVIRMTESFPRSIEMMVAILVGEHPRFLFVPTPSHPEVKEQVRKIRWELAWLAIEVGALLLLGGGLTILLWRRVRMRRRQARTV